MSNFVNTVDSIGDEALTNSIIDRSITEIQDNYATSIGNRAFQSCSALTTASFQAATSISNSAFYSCTALTTADFPAVTSIGDQAFQSCSKLTTVDFPAVTSIGTSAFQSCSALMTANFPAATSIGNYIFQSCSKLTTVDFPVATSIGGGAFNNCAALSTANFPAATSIYSNAFNGCFALTTANFPMAESINSNTFKGCSKLTTVDFPVATSIGPSAFHNCSALTTADFPAVTKISSDAFLSCSKLTALILRSATMATLGSTSAFSSTPIASGTGYIYVPAALVDTYKAASNWSTYANQIRAIEDYPEICEPYTWGAVAKHIELGDYATFYKVGDCVPLDLGSEGVVNMQIAAFDADDLADGSGTAAISWVAVNLCPTTHRMNPSIVDNGDGTYEEGTGMIGGWEKCELRAYLQNTIKPMIPVDVAAMIKTVSKTQTAFRPSGTYFTQTTSDEVWIPNSTELGTGKIYPNVSLKKRYTGAVFDQYWWTRNSASEKLGYCYTNSGKGRGYDPTNNYYICLGFCT